MTASRQPLDAASAKREFNLPFKVLIIGKKFIDQGVGGWDTIEIRTLLTLYLNGIDYEYY